jgi:hypothetical protein
VPPVGVPPVAGKPRNRRVRLWVAMGLGIVVLLCLGGVGVFVSLYDNATAIKRSEPDVVVDDFLRAYLVNRDDNAASLYTCNSGADLSQIAAYRADIVRREKEFSVGIRVTWTSLDVATNGAGGSVTTTLIKTTTDQSGRQAGQWRFGIVDQDGWRVCQAAPVP